MEEKLEAQKEVIKWMRTTPDLAGCGRGNPEEWRSREFSGSGLYYSEVYGIDDSENPSDSLETFARVKVRLAINSFKRHYIVNRDHYA